MRDNRPDFLISAMLAIAGCAIFLVGFFRKDLPVEMAMSFQTAGIGALIAVFGLFIGFSSHKRVSRGITVAGAGVVGLSLAWTMWWNLPKLSKEWLSIYPLGLAMMLPIFVTMAFPGIKVILSSKKDRFRNELVRAAQSEHVLLAGRAIADLQRYESEKESADQGSDSPQDSGLLKMFDGLSEQDQEDLMEYVKSLIRKRQWQSLGMFFMLLSSDQANQVVDQVVRLAAQNYSAIPRKPATTELRPALTLFVPLLLFELIALWGAGTLNYAILALLIVTLGLGLIERRMHQHRVNNIKDIFLKGLYPADARSELYSFLYLVQEHQRDWKEVQAFLELVAQEKQP